jgi:D-glycero-alpha-D-manno-heptose-7-phosphate kinase
MIVSSCPLRVSLVGGSTDHPDFIKKYKSGSVISFASNFKTYSILHRDVLGHNSLNRKYIINYSQKELVDNISEIENELVRFCFQELEVTQINCYLTSDIFSTGSGLASSSSYLLSLIKSILQLNNQKKNIHEICQLAKKIERKFNPLVGEQDFYGGSIGGLKRINFKENQLPTIEILDDSLFDLFDVYLYHTKIGRDSTSILKTINIDQSLPLLKEVDNLHRSIINCDRNLFFDTINESWNLKKRTSPHICTGELIEIDEKLSNDIRVKAHKLCGAGGGGYFLIFSEINVNLENDFPNIKKIKISKKGLTCKEI